MSNQTVREQVRMIEDGLRDSHITEGTLERARHQCLDLVADNIKLFANAQDVLAERDALKAEVERLRGVIERAVRELDYGLHRGTGYAAGIKAVDVLRATLQPQGDE